MKKWSKYLSIGLAGWLAMAGFASVAQAKPVQINGARATIAEGSPMIIAGDEDDFPNGAPILPAGVFTGVVSINIRYDGFSFICSGSVIGQRHVITAGHCVDETGFGNIVDIADPNKDVRVVFNDGGVITQITTANAVNVHPDYSGFGLCGPDGAGGFFRPQCLNDDIAVLTLEEDIPAGVDIYGFAGPGAIDGGSLLTMVGHGVSGDGFFGEYLNPSFSVKRFGFNFAEFFDCDDETSSPTSGGFTSTAACGDFFGNHAEVWYADFDGYDSFADEFDIPGYEDGDFDTFCDFFGVGCGNGLGADLTGGLFEAQIGGGDSGGPSFIYDFTNNQWLLAGNNTFGTCGFSPFADPEEGFCGYFGEIFGGNLYAPYVSWINTIVPEPATLGLLGMGLMMIGASRRRRKA